MSTALQRSAAAAWRRVAVVAAAMALAGAVRADTLDLVTGDHMVGRIVSVCSTNVTFTNGFVGTVRITRSAIVRLSTEAPVRLALTNGDRLLGVLGAAPDGLLAVTTSNAAPQVVATGAVVAVWLPGSPDPTLPPPRLAWKNSIAFDLHGQNGNTRSFYAGGGIETMASASNMDLKLFGRGSDATSDDVLSERKLVGGADFEQRFARIHSLYMRDEAQRDDVLGIRFRNMVFYGYGYYFFREPDRMLRLRLGLGHTLTEYVATDKERESNISADSGLKYSQRLGKYASWSSEVIDQPVLKDRANYYITHESKVSVPLALPNLTEEFGIANEYLSQPGNGQKPLDTTYFIRTKYAW